MCGTYIYFDTKAVSARFNAKVDPQLTLEPRYNIKPGSVNPTVSQQSPNTVVMRKWGLVPFWAKDPKIGYKLINARSETVAEKPSFRKAFRSARCLVPANGYVEWKGEGETKQPYYFQLHSKESFAIAGLYELWKDAEERPLETYTLLTMEAQGVAKEVHHRMPVILTRENEERWVDRNLSEEEEIKKLIKNTRWEEFEAHPISKEINSGRNSYPELIQRE